MLEQCRQEGDLLEQCRFAGAVPTVFCQVPAGQQYPVLAPDGPTPSGAGHQKGSTAPPLQHLVEGVCPAPPKSRTVRHLLEAVPAPAPRKKQDSLAQC